MAFYKTRKCLSFDDVLLVPKYSEIESRHDVDISPTTYDDNPVVIGSRKMLLPIFSAPMDTVVNETTAVIMANNGMSPILHRYCTEEEQVLAYESVVKLLEKDAAPVGAAIGSGNDCLNRMIALYDKGCRLFCVDVAHGHHKMPIFAVKSAKHLFPDSFIVAGNVATREGFEALADAGADAVRVGVGGGAVCSTRVVTGHGIPTFQSVVECAESDRDCYIIADGGIKNTGDIVKSLAAGADFVMLGSMLSCKKESPGETKTVNGVTYKNYRGMASKSAQLEWRGKVSVSEGVDSWKAITESLEESINNIVSGVRSGLSYSGCKSLSKFYALSEFIQVTSTSVKENVPHAKGAIF